MTLAQTIQLRTDNGLAIVDFLLDVMHDRYEDFQICHRLQAAKLLTTYGNDDAPNFIDDNAQEPQSNRNGRRPRRPTKFDTELARVIKEDTRDGRSVAYFLIEVMEGGRREFKPHHRMSAARELLDRGFGKSASKEKTTQHTPSPGGEGWGEGENPAHVHPEPAEGPKPSTDDTNQIREIPKSDEPSKRLAARQSQFTQITAIPESDESQFRQLRDTLPYLHPDDFEETVHEFIENIGDVPSNHLEYIGDEVIDGIIDLDPIGLDRVHFRAKLSIDPIDELEIRDFSGSLDRRGAATGLFITTSDFTDVARRAAEMVSTGNRHIRLVDGSELARFLAYLNMGDKTTSAPCTRKLDEDHFAEHT